MRRSLTTATSFFFNDKASMSDPAPACDTTRLARPISPGMSAVKRNQDRFKAACSSQPSGKPSPRPT